MDRREGWRNRATRKRRGDDEVPGGDPWRQPAGPEQAAFQIVSPRPGRAVPLPASGPEIDAVVKWFDSGKGFGFVELADGSGDAFLHVSVVERFGGGIPTAGAAIRLRLGRGPKGPQVAEITELREAAPGVASPARWHAPGSRHGHTLSHSVSPGQEIRGTVKWYNAQKGFGFITPETGGKDVFVHVSTLGRSGLGDLAPGQAVRLQMVAGKKGPEAVFVSIT